MVTNEQIRRARPQVGSPLGRLIKGEISRPQYEQEVKIKHSQEEKVRRSQMGTPQA